MSDAVATEPISALSQVSPKAGQSPAIELLGYQIDLVSTMIIVMIIGILYMFWRIQASKKLDFTDMITKDGRTVSLTKVLQLVGGLTATWILIKLTLTENLTEGILAIYLAYVASIEGYSKFISAKYKYSENSVNRPGYPYEYDPVFERGRPVHDGDWQDGAARRVPEREQEQGQNMNPNQKRCQ